MYWFDTLYGRLWLITQTHTYDVLVSAASLLIRSLRQLTEAQQRGRRSRVAFPVDRWSRT